MEFWDEMAPVVKQAAHYWHDSTASIAWCRHAWESLTDAPSRDPDDPLGIAEQAVLLLALCQLHEEFCEVAAGGSVSVGYSFDAPPDLVDRVALGMLVERQGLDVFADIGTDTDAVLANLAAVEVAGVLGRLRSAWGESDLFASLWATRWPETTYPLDEGAISAVVNDVTPDKGAAYEWLSARG